MREAPVFMAAQHVEEWTMHCILDSIEAQLPGGV